jgi:hypothetical protein
MTIQIKTGAGANDWSTVTNPQIKTGAGANDWVNVNKGEIKTGTGANDWTTFYQRFSGATNPTITLSSKTFTSITVRVQTSNPERKRVIVYRGNDLSTVQSFPLAENSPTTSSIDQTFTFSGLTDNTSYTFYCYTNFYAEDGTFIESSQTVSLTVSTLSYTITTPTAPSNTSRGQYALNFEATSNANYSTNASTAYIQFELEALDIFSGWYYVATENSTNLTSNDNDQSKQVTFANLTSGTTYRCRARTVYSTISKNSGWSQYSANITTLKTVVKTTGFVSSNNTTHLSSGVIIASSEFTPDYPASKSSNNNFDDQWLSYPWSSITDDSESRTVVNGARGFGVLVVTPTTAFTGGVADDAKLDGVTNVRYTGVRVWTRNTGFGRLVTLYFLSDVPFGLNTTVTLSGFSNLNIDGSRTITGVDQYSPEPGIIFYRKSFFLSTAVLTGSESNPTIFLSAYAQIGSFSTNKTKQKPYSVTTNTDGNITNITFSDSGTDFPNARLVNGTLTRYYKTYTPKGSGSETLNVLFEPKDTYTSPRMINGSNHLRVKNGSQARTITASINDISLGSLAFAADEIKDFPIPSQITPRYDAFLGKSYFNAALSVPRISTAFGYYATIYEVQLSYSYNVLE